MMDFEKMNTLDSAELVALSTEHMVDNVAKSMSNPKLMALRAQNPFITIMPFPNSSISMSLTANVARDINLPSGTKMIMFSGNGEYFVSRNGNAVIPTASAPEATGSIMNPEFCFFFVDEVRQMSAIAPFDMRLTVHCFIQL
jgi:hypothetical protein